MRFASNSTTLGNITVRIFYGPVCSTQLNFLVMVKGNHFVTVCLTRAEFLSSYPTFDDGLKLSVEHWVCSFVPDFLFGRKPLQPPSPNY
jgi:hypothetical protein